ncbi:MAG: hypothetical protein R6W78_07250 [Bacteroidales bacterium]
MYLKEKREMLTLISSILIFGFYALFVYQRFIEANPEIIHDFQFWGKRFMVFIPIAIVAQILIHILFAIVNKIVTKEDIPTISDEMDKMIELKALRISHWVCNLGLILSLGSQAIGMQPWVMIIVLISLCFVSSIVEGIAKIYYYQKGI